MWKRLNFSILRRSVRVKSISRHVGNNHEALQIGRAMLTHVRNAQQCASSDFDAVFCYRSEIRSALPDKFGIFHQPMHVAQRSIE